MKQILIVGAYFYPDNTPRSFRTTELAKELVRQGHTVTVLVPNRAKVQENLVEGDRLTIKDMGEMSWRVPSPKGNAIFRLSLKIINRIAEQFLYLPKIQLLFLTRKALQKEKGYDLLISIASPHSIHWGVAEQMKLRKGELAKLWVADCGDPFMLADNLQYNRPFYFQYFEKKFCRIADVISVPFEGAKEGYYPEFREKLVVIPQGFRFEDVVVDKKEKPTNQVVSFAYAGSLIPKRRDPEELINYLLQQGRDFRFYIYSKRHQVVEALAERYPERIILRQYVQRADLLKHLHTLDFVVNFDNVGTTQLPSKLIDYAILDKPILAIKYGELDVKVVDQFFERDFSNAYLVKNVDQYRIENIASRFIDLLG